VLKVPTASLTAKLIELVNARPVSDADLAGTALFTLDALAAMRAAKTTSVGSIVLDWASAESMTAGREAFVLGALSNILEMDSMHTASRVHAGTVVVPAALAVARSRGSKGRSTLEAILRGCEVAFRIGCAAGPAHYKNYQNTSTCGPYGAAMASATLLDLNHLESRHALGNAGTQSGGSWEFLSDGATSKQFHAGRAAEAGVVSAQLAKRGFTGPSQILEGKKGFFELQCPDSKADEVLRDPNGPWELTRNSMKPWPCPKPTHPVIDAALCLYSEIGQREIKSAAIETFDAAIQLCDSKSVDSSHGAKSSMRYCAVAALHDGRIDFASFSPPALTAHGSKVAMVSAQSRARFNDAFAAGKWGAQVSVVLADGTELSCCKMSAKGDPESPMDRDEILDKARYLLAMTGEDKADRLIHAVLTMVDDGPVPVVELGSSAHRS
jgi:2-methylcitrate dehydratase PrpD